MDRQSESILAKIARGRVALERSINSETDDETDD
jgi:hypothetical protein